LSIGTQRDIKRDAVQKKGITVGQTFLFVIGRTKIPVCPYSTIKESFLDGQNIFKTHRVIAIFKYFIRRR
jgi:hypothetical protein